MEERKKLQEVKSRLIEAGGRASQDLGTGRIVGQILVYLYLQENECSLDDMAEELGLSKASVSIAVRQLEQLGLARKVWKSGDKRNYYKSAENIGKALQHGILTVVRQKVLLFGEELDDSLELIESVADKTTQGEKGFLQQRIQRAKKLQNALDKILGNPFIQFFADRSTDKH